MNTTSFRGYVASPADSGWIASAIHALARSGMVTPLTEKILTATTAFTRRIRLTNRTRCALWTVCCRVGIALGGEPGGRLAVLRRAPIATFARLPSRTALAHQVADITRDQAKSVHPRDVVAVHIGTTEDATLATCGEQGRFPAGQIRPPVRRRTHDRSFFRKKLARDQRVDASQRGKVRYNYAMGRPRLGRTDSVEVPLPPDLKQEFKQGCDEIGRSMTDVANELFAEWVAQQRKAPKQQSLPLMELQKAS